MFNSFNSPTWNQQKLLLRWFFFSFSFTLWCVVYAQAILNCVHHANRLSYFSDLSDCSVNLLLKAFMENCLSCLPSSPQLASFNIYIIVALPVFPQFLFTVMTFIYFRVSLAITGGHGFLFFQAAAGFSVCFCGVISRQGLI